ncbi:hypothetical protein [Roseateles oligotrophus]|uniref:Uncharacterized protein n=1 Tax=Roseateles oligotrophus TaxID=1769250 RepID=A0ABT2YC02_9BURK|nr:hypothetical protein [Roseateles oligotrophus]MCV2367325.1 hypothetical protein [Roseateles oligotrophus]
MSIDSRRWQREGIFTAGRSGTWQWRDPYTGKPSATISYRGLGDAVVLQYSIGDKQMHQHIELTHTGCNFGGARTWFACPNCCRRVAKLFMRSGAGFICRHCGRLRYASQSTDAVGRTWLKQYKAEAKLDKYHVRPKGMHHATRAKLLTVIHACEEQRDRALCAFMTARFPNGWPW